MLEVTCLLPGAEGEASANSLDSLVNHFHICLMFAKLNQSLSIRHVSLHVLLVHFDRICCVLILLLYFTNLLIALRPVEIVSWICIVNFLKVNLLAWDVGTYDCFCVEVDGCHVVLFHEGFIAQLFQSYTFFYLWSGIFFLLHFVFLENIFDFTKH